MSAVRTFVSDRRAQINAALSVRPDISAADHPQSVPCTQWKITGSFAATWGTSGTVPPFQTGSAASRGHVNKASARSVAGAADAGLSLTDPNPHLASITLYFRLANGTLAVLPMTVNSTLLKTGAVVAMDGKQVNATFLFLDGVTTGGFLEDGKN